MMMKQDQSETSIFMNANEDDQNIIRQEFKQYLQDFLVQMALAKKYSDQYNNVANSPVKIRIQEKSSKRSSSDESGGEEIDPENEESTIILEKIDHDDLQDRQEIISPPIDSSMIASNNQDESIKQQALEQQILRQKAQEEQKRRSKSKGKNETKIQKINDKFQQITVSETRNSTNLQKLKKINQLKKKAIKQILEYNNMFNMKFILAWTKTNNYLSWLNSFDTNIAALSPQAGVVPQALIYYENGDYYQGNLLNGIRQGIGLYYEQNSALNYNGEWFEDMRHGQGHLSSISQDYVFDGEWFQGMKQGKGQLITKKEKFSGNFYKDRYHKNGVLVESDGSVYEGDWVLGKKEGMGQYRLSNGSFYIGEFFNDKFEGKGQLKYKALDPDSSELYNGDFKEGLRHGTGQMISSDQLTQYNGEWVRDKRHGQGMLILTNKVSGQQKYIAAEWIDDQIQFDKPVKMTIQGGKTQQHFEGLIDQQYNPIFE